MKLVLGIPFMMLALGAQVEFYRDVRPILSDHCYTCHGPDEKARVSGIRFDREESARRTIVNGKPQESSLIKRVVSNDEATRMPPAWAGKPKLAAKDLEILRQWIEQGAPWQAHWSFVPPVRPNVPAGANPIDYFVRARLEREGLKPAVRADKLTLARRAALDVTGLPPTPAEAEDFANDASPNAWERYLDGLFASPRFAERMAMRWLDAARYADTNGYQSDGPRDMWRYRDWVINAFARNMPFDRFTLEQIAGDLLPGSTVDNRVATAFHRNHRTSAEGGIVEEEFRVEYVADRTETTANVWLGMTLGCARCHDHKYDPFQQRDFYRLFAFFNNTPDRGLVYNFGNEEPFIQAPLPEHERKLAEYTAAADAARARWQALRPALDRERRAWEASLRKAPPLAWAIEGNLVLTAGAQRFAGDAGFDAGEGANFDYRDPHTLAAWIRPEAADGAILSRSEDYWEGSGYMLLLKGGKVRLHETLRFTDISLRLETETTVPLNEWTHVTMTYDGYRKAKGVHIYFNGVEQKIKVEFDEATYPFASKRKFLVGAGGGLRFRGAIEDVRAYNTALTPEEAATLAVRQTINQIAAIPEKQRTPAQRDKLEYCFLDRAARSEFREVRNRLIAAERERRLYNDSIPTVMVMVEGPVRPAFVLKRGAYDAHGEPVSAAAPAVLAAWNPEWPANRVGLARWLTARSNPLTARVTVNRFWQMLFGTGIVKTVQDFGAQGDPPSHPELLDWLAVEFMDHGWDMRHILKTMMLSETYRQSSSAPPALLERDPENRLLARGARFRLPAEMIRDQALAISGLLVEHVGGPSVKPYQPPGLWQELAGGRGYVQDHGDALYRRSLYTYWKRTVAPPSLSNFDAPTRENCTVTVTRTNTPLQALDLMNDITYVEAARRLAERMLKQGGATDDERLAYAWRLALLRAPSEKEARVLRDALTRFESRYARDEQAARALLNEGESLWDTSLPAARLAAFTGVASLILNLDEMVTRQ